MKTIESEIEIIDEICSRRDAKKATEAIEYMSSLFHYYHHQIDSRAELSSEGLSKKRNWVYSKIKVYLDIGEKFKPAEKYLRNEQT